MVEDAGVEGLVERASRGDAVAVETLLENELPRLRTFVHLRMGPALRAREETVDLVQSVCRVILARRDQFRHEGGEQFRRWLLATARRVVADKAKYWRRDQRDAAREEPRLLDDDFATVADSVCSQLTPSRVASARERLARFERAYATLPDDYREVIALARVLELPHKEVAERLGRSELATRTLLHRALAALSATLDEP